MSSITQGALLQGTVQHTGERHRVASSPFPLYFSYITAKLIDAMNWNGSFVFDASHIGLSFALGNFNSERADDMTEGWLIQTDYFTY